MDSSVVSRKMPVRRSDRFLFSSSDDNMMMKQVEATHAPDDRDFAIKPVLHIVEDIFHRATPDVLGIVLDVRGQLHAMDDGVLLNGLDEMLELLSRTIYKISCELSCKCTSGGDPHSTAMAILNILKCYRWDAKLVLALSGFAVIYGEFWLGTQLYPTNQLAKGIALLKQLPAILERGDALRPKLEAVTKLIQAMVNVTKCIVEFKDLPEQYISFDAPELLNATAHIPTAVYWTIRSAVACAAQIVELIGMGHEYIASTQETWELLSLAHKLNSIHEHLMTQLTLLHQLIAERQNMEAYKTLERLFSTPHVDNMKILKALIYAKDDQLPLYDGTAKKKVHIDMLRRKLVLLLVSDLDVSPEEIMILDQMFQEARQNPTRSESQYEVIWLPVVDRSVPWGEQRQKQFEALQTMMPWYSVHHPSMVDPAVIKYMKEEWRFNKRPLIVVLDPQGKVVNHNAIHMMWIWGSVAYPFTRTREESLWKEESWRIELLADSIEPSIFNWIAEPNTYICLYGGEDIEWIEKFTTTAKAVAKAASIKLEMLYVGKSNPREKVKRNNAIIQNKNLSHTLPEPTLIWFFWVRLESMWHSKTEHHAKNNIENDPIMQEIMTMLSFDGSEQGWALLCKGSTQIAKAKGDTILKCFDDFKVWKEGVNEKGFVPTVNDYLLKLHTPHHCNRLILPGTTGGIPERVVCAECGRSMEKYIMYRCCTD